MAKEYEIKVHVDLSQSDAALARRAQGIGKIEKQHPQAGDAQEKAAKRGGDAQFVSFLKLDAQAQKLSSKIADQADRTANAQERAAQKAANAQEKANQRAFNSSFVSSLKLESQAEKLSSKIADQAAKQATAQTTAAERAQNRITAMAGRSLTDQEVQAKASGAINQWLNDRRIAAATKVVEAERVAGMSIRDRMKEEFDSFTSWINPASIAMTAGLALVGVGIARIAQGWADTAKSIDDSVKFTNKYRDLLPGTAALKGHLGDTTTEAKESLLLRSKTLQTVDQARGFEEGMLNTGQASLGRRIMQDQFDELKVSAGSFQAAEGGDATTHGELVGRLPALMQLKKDAAGKEIPLSANQVLGEE